MKQKNGVSSNTKKSFGMSTHSIQHSVMNYFDCVSKAVSTVEMELRELNTLIENELMTIGLAAHFIVMVQVRGSTDLI